MNPFHGSSGWRVTFEMSTLNPSLHASTYFVGGTAASATKSEHPPAPAPPSTKATSGDAPCADRMQSFGPPSSPTTATTGKRPGDGYAIVRGDGPPTERKSCVVPAGSLPVTWIVAD